jgi:GNAT superfamily N-acetyltransferase
MTPVLSLTDDPTDSDSAVLSNGLTEFNIQKTGYYDRRTLAALVRDPETGATLGGMIGKTSYGVLFIDTVFLPEDLRGQDTGRRLLAMMEQEGVKRGCKSGFLHTITFQAPGFYERHGWTEFGRIACDPPGSARVFFTKTLAPLEA